MELSNIHISDPAWDQPDQQIVVRVCNKSNAPFAWKIGDEIAIMTIQSRHSGGSTASRFLDENRAMPLQRQLSDASVDSSSMGFLDDQMSISLAQTSPAKETYQKVPGADDPITLYGTGLYIVIDFLVTNKTRDVVPLTLAALGAFACCSPNCKMMMWQWTGLWLGFRIQSGP